MFGLPFLDVAVIIGYFTIIFGIGIWASRRICNQEDYFLGGRRFGKFIQTFAAFGQGTSADSAVSSVVTVARNGVAGIWNNLLLGVFLMPIFWITSIWYRRMRVLTLGDFFEERYNSKGLPAIYALVSSFFFMLVIAIGFSAMSKTIAAIVIKPEQALTSQEKTEYQRAVEWQKLERTDSRLLTPQERNTLTQLRIEKPRLEFSYINERILILGVALVAVIYTIMGGLVAAFVCDTIQGILIIILSLILFPFSVVKLNHIYGGQGMGGIIEIAQSRLPQSMFELWGSPAMLDFTWYFVLALMAMSTINVAVQANQVTAIGSAKDEYTGRYGFCMGTYLKRFCTLFWGVTSLVLVMLYGARIANPDYIWGVATRDLLGTVGLGLVGLMIACLMAALLSTADALMLTSSSLMTHNFFRPLFPNLSEKNYVWMGRFFCAVFIFGSILFAFSFESIWDMMKLMWEFNIVLAASFWLGIKWRRANRLGAWCSMASTLLLFVILPLIIPMLPGVRSNAYLTKTVNSIVIHQTFTARAIDAEQRQQEIVLWEELRAAGLSDGVRPEPLTVGQRFTKEYITPPRSIFWAQDLRTDSAGNVSGKGMLFLELVALDKLGFDLSGNPYALNETIRFLIRMGWPFLILILAAKWTKPDDKAALDRFYAKMKTPAQSDRAIDDAEVKLSLENPTRFDHKKMFPNSNWEFEKFDRIDIQGMIWLSVAGVFILILVYLISLIGGK